MISCCLVHSSITLLSSIQPCQRAICTRTKVGTHSVSPPEDGWIVCVCGLVSILDGGR
jgi:hypothetical protein